MIKIIDVDKLFDKYISDYVYSNIGKVKPEEIENQIPLLYEKFGDANIKELDGLTPNTYYASFSDSDKIECLKAHLDNKVSVSDFLCEALEKSPDSDIVIKKELEKDLDEEYTLYLMNVLSAKGTAPIDRYLEFVTLDYSPAIREFATEVLCGFANDIKEKVLLLYRTASDSAKSCLAEILSRTTERDDRVFDILIEGFVKNRKEIPLYASYIARYGDEHALPFLNTALSDEKLSYADFEEIRFAIEALGGECEKARDFSSDKTYKKIKSAKNVQAENTEEE